MCSWGGDRHLAVWHPTPTSPRCAPTPSMSGELLGRKGGRCAPLPRVSVAGTTQMIIQFLRARYTNCHLLLASMKTRPLRTAKLLQNRHRAVSQPLTQEPDVTRAPRCPPSDPSTRVPAPTPLASPASRPNSSRRSGESKKKKLLARSAKNSVL